MTALSFSQEQLYLRELQAPEIPPLYNECVTLHIAGPLDVRILERCFTEIIRRHESWRTTFDSIGEKPVQVSHPAPEMPIRLPLVDLRVLPRKEREAEAIRLVGEDARRPFDMRRGPLLRPTLVRMDDAEHRLYLIAHQIILDGMSAYQIFPSEMALLYKAFCNGQASPLPELPIQCADFARWQRDYLQGKEWARQVGYWRKQLPEKPEPLRWPNYRSRPPIRTFRGTIRNFALPKHLALDIKELSRREGVTLFMTLLTGFASLLYRYTNQEHIIVGTLSPAGRKRSEVLGLLGYFLNPVALLFRFGRRLTFREMLQETRKLISDAISHDDVPLEFLERELLQKTDASRSPFFTAAVSLQPPTPALDLEWTVTSMDVESGGASWDLYIAFIDRPDGLIGRAQFNPDLFHPEEISLMLEDLERLLGQACANPLQPVKDMPCVKEEM